MDNVTSIDDYYDKKIEKGELFAICLNPIADAEGVYLKKGYVYQVTEMIEDCWIIEGEDCTVKCKKTDPDIKVVASGEVN